MLLRPEGLFPSRRRRRELHESVDEVAEFESGRGAGAVTQDAVTQPVAESASAAQPEAASAQPSLLGRRASPSASAAWWPCAAWTSTSRPARSSASSARTVPARRRSSTSSPALTEPTDGNDRRSPASRIVAKAVRTWAEPLVWFVPPLLIALIGVVLLAGRASRSATTGDPARGSSAWSCCSLVAMVRPPGTCDCSPGLGIFRSARPNEMVGARHRPDLPEHPAVREHDRPRERAWSACTAGMHASPLDAALRLERHARRRRRPQERGTQVARVRRPEGPRQRDGPQPALRRPAPAGDRPGAREPAEAAAAGRADGRHEPDPRRAR